MNLVASSAPKIEGERWELYRLLSEPTRLRLLALAAEEELSVGELSELLGESQPQVSRHAAPLREAGLLVLRKQGTRSFLQLAPEATRDPVVADALGSGRALAASDGSLARVPVVVAEREGPARAFFAARSGEVARPVEMAPYVAAFAALLPRREVAIDAGTGDGGLLELLSPSFGRVLAFDREAAQVERAEQRVRERGLKNVELRVAEPTEVAREWSGTADVVFAVRMLHHAGKPAELLKTLARLCRAPDAKGPGGAVVVVDYAHHDDESMRKQADLWLGFEPAELRRYARAADLEVSAIVALPPP
ncbi:MAG: metalloregulator ArsR/SmtB family transcription factor, partial [Proteobacteria bacterium]